MTTDPLLLRLASLLNAVWVVGRDARKTIIDSCCPDGEAERIRDKMLDLAARMETFFGVEGVSGPSFRELNDAVNTWALYDPAVEIRAEVRPVARLDAPEDVEAAVRTALLVRSTEA